MSSWELTNVLARLVLPPGLLLLLALIGIALVRSRVRYGAGLTLFSVIALYILSTPVVGSALLASLHPPYVDPVKDTSPGAIVVLGAGVYAAPLEYGVDAPTAASLERARYAMHLQRRTGKPILVAGGSPAGHLSPEAEVIRTTLREYGANVKWVEDRSDNTFESARFSAEILRKAGIKSVYLVTHAWHMPRARMAFERAGIHVVPAGTGYVQSTGTLSLMNLVPSGFSLHCSYLFFHEMLGLLWYRLRFDLAG